MLFVLNQSIATASPTVVVDGGLAPGKHRFRLVVVNDRGQKSAPTEITVTVLGLGPIPIPVPVTPSIVVTGPLPTPSPAIRPVRRRRPRRPL